jgi:hypothetical protein
MFVEYLKAGNNRISGEVPSEIGLMKNLGKSN